MSSRRAGEERMGSEIDKMPQHPEASSTGEAAGGSSGADPFEGVSVRPKSFYNCVSLKCKGLNDETDDMNTEIREAMGVVGHLLDECPSLELRVAETEEQLLEALKLYRDMNHLSLAGGITCEHVINHVQSHTVLLYYTPPDDADAAAIAVTAATFSMRQSTMMLRLLATHPRMTRKGFARITVHFLKELCRALHKTDILVYTYPSSASFYKAQHFYHTHSPRQLESERPAGAAIGAGMDAAASREAQREARRVFSAHENEMIFHVQSTLEQVLHHGLKRDSTAHPYACTRKRAHEQPPPAPPPPPPPAQNGSRGPASRGTQRAAAGARGASSSSSSGSRKGGERRGSSRGGGARAGGARASGSSAAAWCAAVSPLFTSPQARGVCDPAANGAAGEHGSLATPMRHDAADDDAADDVDHADDEGAGEPPTRKGRKRSKSEYQVEDIVGVRSHGGDLQYLIKWKGCAEMPRRAMRRATRAARRLTAAAARSRWPSKFNTWEPVEHLRNLQAELDAFDASLRTARQ